MAHFHHNCTIPSRKPFADKFGMTGQDQPRHNLRLTADLKSKLAHAAIDNGRSMNAEILARLEASFAPEPAEQLTAILHRLTFASDEERSQAVAHLTAALGLIASARSEPTR